MSVGRMLVTFGALLLVVGLLWMGAEKLGLGRLPGDLRWQGKGWSVHFPVVTSIVVSVVLTVLLNVFFGGFRK